jgi:hypothetical protein
MVAPIPYSMPPPQFVTQPAAQAAAAASPSPRRPQTAEVKQADKQEQAAAAAATSSPRRPQTAEEKQAQKEAMRQHAAQREWQREENRRALEMLLVTPPAHLKTKEPQIVVDGARVCTGRGCGHIIPAEGDYPSTACGGCTERARRKEAKLLGQVETSVAVLDGWTDLPLVSDPFSEMG